MTIVRSLSVESLPEVNSAGVSYSVRARWHVCLVLFLGRASDLLDPGLEPRVVVENFRA